MPTKVHDYTVNIISIACNIF